MNYVHIITAEGRTILTTDSLQHARETLNYYRAHKVPCAHICRRVLSVDAVQESRSHIVLHTECRASWEIFHYAYDSNGKSVH